MDGADSSGQRDRFSYQSRGFKSLVREIHHDLSPSEADRYHFWSSSFLPENPFAPYVMTNRGDFFTSRLNAKGKGLVVCVPKVN
jgi:hypothetical protein